MSDQLQDLAAIRRLMDDAQRTVQDDGKYFLTWGLLSIAGLTATWVAVRWQTLMVYLWTVWAVLIVGGWILALWWGRRDRAHAGVHTVAGSMVGDIWAGVGIGLTILVFAGAAAGSIAPAAVSGVVAALFGVGAFASSSVYRQLPMRVMAFVWWVGAAFMLLRPGTYAILLLTVMVLVLLVAPSLVLRARARDQARVEPT